VAYAHGFTSLGDNARYFGEHLASHGYIVAAPLFPLTRRDAPGGPTIADEPQQPADLAFVLDQVARLGGEDADLAAAVDVERRGVMGLSAGGLTVLIAAYHPLLRLEGIQAAVAQAPVSCFFGPAFYARSLPTLIIAGTADELVPLVGPEKAFSLAPPPVTLLELEGGTHTGFMNREIPFVANNDTPECERLLSFNPMSGDAAFNEALTRGVGPGVIDPTGCTPLCATRFAQTMGASRQIELSRVATLAHFEAVLKGRPDAGEFLREQLSTQAPDAQVRTRQ
jgi:dienelactone hydrolase